MVLQPARRAELDCSGALNQARAALRCSNRLQRASVSFGVSSAEKSPLISAAAAPRLLELARPLLKNFAAPEREVPALFRLGWSRSVQ